MLSAGHIMATAFTISWQLWLPAEASQSSGIGEKDDLQFQPLPRSYWRLVVAGGWRFILYWGDGHWHASHDAMDGSIPTHMWAALDGLSRLSKQNKENILPAQKNIGFGGGRLGRIQWQLDGGSEADILLYLCMKLSKIKKKVLIWF